MEKEMETGIIIYEPFHVRVRVAQTKLHGMDLSRGPSMWDPYANFPF